VNITSLDALFGLEMNGLTLSDSGADTLLSFETGGTVQGVLLEGIDDPLIPG